MKQMKLSKRKPTTELTIGCRWGRTERLLPSHTPARSGHCFFKVLRKFSVFVMAFFLRLHKTAKL
jgi:hypothetical protein